MTPLPLLGVASITSCRKQDNIDQVGQQIYDDAIAQFMHMARIPHCSNEDGHTDSLVRMQHYLMNTALKAKAVNIQTDDAGNVWYDIPASEGCEDYQKIMFQGHMDMVWKATGEAEQWDKWTHPIAQPVIEKDENGITIMHSKDYLTTLGADDGMATALMLSLAINQNIFKHGVIRCIFTANEENGYPGAEVLGQRASGDVSVINHDEGFDYLVNFDTGPLGAVIFNSGGGYGGNVTLDITNVLATTNYYQLDVTDCLGGHSGVDIAKGRANPLQLVAQALNELQKAGANICIVSCSSTDAAQTSIPTNASIGFTTNKSFADTKTALNNWFLKVKDNYKVEEDMKMNFVDKGSTNYCMPLNYSDILINFVSNLPFGAVEYFPAPEESVVKCSANIGPITFTSGATTSQLKLTFSGRQNLREDVDKYKASYDDLLKTFIKAMGGTVGPSTFSSGSWYPWIEQEDCKIIDVCLQAYNDIGVEGHRARVHGGIECADFKGQNEYLTEVSLGANLYDEHAVNETLDLDSYLLSAKLFVKICEKMNF